MNERRPDEASWRPVRLELPVVVLLSWCALAAVSLSAGGVGLSWDALNHHIYLGWSASANRLDLDFMAAGSQSTQFPYLYWPAYQLAVHGAGPLQVAVVLTSLHTLGVPALWLIARHCIPGDHWEAALWRGMAVLLAISSPVVLFVSDNTSNDLLAAIPLVWSIALALRAGDVALPAREASRAWVLSGVLAGVAVACKFSNAPLAIFMPVLWWMGAQGARHRLARVASAVGAASAGFFLVYGYWGWLLWQRFGNPVYPFAQDWFASPARVLGGAG